MTEAARAYADRAGGRRARDVVNDVVWAIGITADTVDPLQVVQPQVIAHPPGDHVIRTGRVTADAEPADDLIDGADPEVESEAPAKHVHAANALADHHVIQLAVAGRVGRRAVGCF